MPRVADSTRQLHRTLGNQALQRLAAQAIQPKLRISQPDDAYELEADRVADQVMRMPAQREQKEAPCAACASGGSTCPNCAAKNALVQRRVGNPGLDSADAPAPDNLLRALGPGRALDAETRAYFEPRFGQDFSDVRIHADARAAESAQAVRAFAYTTGRDVVFGAGQYTPATARGRRLLAHELVHTLQQRSAGAGSQAQVQRTEYSDCTDQQLTDYVFPAKAQAIADLDSVIADLDARPLPDLTAGALWLAFRRQDEATAASVKATLQEIRTGLDSGTIECEQPGGWQFMCERGRLGYTTMFETMHICMNSWPGASITLRANNLIHEGAHAFAWLVGDPGYFSRGCAETAGTAVLSAARRLGTPDAYSCFVHYMRHDTGIAARAQEYKGASLALVQDPAGSIDLNSTDVRTPAFRMDGVPGHSGFRFRWVISDAADNSYLLRADSGNPFQYGNHPRTYIGAATRALLKDRGISAAELRCRVDIPGIGDRLFRRDLRFTS